MTPLDDLLPRFHFAERHSRPTAASPEEALAAVRSVTPRDAPLLGALFLLRGLPARPRAPVVDQMLAGGFEILADPGHELVMAAIGRPWKLSERLHPGADFRRFAEPGYAKMALAFWVEGGSLHTETRVLLTDDEARRSFARYWRAVRPLSGLTRRSWLRAAKRRIESKPRARDWRAPSV